MPLYIRADSLLSLKTSYLTIHRKFPTKLKIRQKNKSKNKIPQNLKCNLKNPLCLLTKQVFNDKITLVLKTIYRGIAQLVEQRSPKPRAEGSSPSAPAKYKSLKMA